MKYLKKYEGFTLFKKGDYVLLNVEDIKSHMYSHGENVSELKDNYAIVLDYDGGRNENYPYTVEFYTGDILRIGYYEIERLLTEDEIKEFKMKKDSIKYNL